MSFLHIDCSILCGTSVSRKISADIVNKLEAASPHATVTYRDVGAAPIPHLSSAYLMVAKNGEGAHEAAMKSDLTASDTAPQEFLAAGTVVIGGSGLQFFNSQPA